MVLGGGAGLWSLVEVLGCGLALGERSPAGIKLPRHHLRQSVHIN